MSAILQIETKNYQVFEVKYGLIIINRTPENNGGKEPAYWNTFFQGDDAANLLSEIELINKKDIKESSVEHWLSGYDDIMNDTITKNELEKIGVYVNSQPLQNSKVKNSI